MDHKYYLEMTKRQAAAALEEHLAERPGALDRLRAALVDHGERPEELLDGTPESLTPLWRWSAERIRAVAHEYAPSVREAVPPSSWPSWARYSGRLHANTPDTVVTLLDGLVAYAGDVVIARAPRAQWQVCHHPVKRYHLQNHPVLSSELTHVNVFPGGLIAVMANVLTSDRHDAFEDDALTGYARGVIDELQHGRLPAQAEPEPLVEIELEDGVFDVGLRQDLAHEHSGRMDRLVKDLRAQPGVVAAHREDREVLLVSAPDWSRDDLERWLTGWIERLVPAAR